MKKQHIIWFILGMGLLASLTSCTSVTAQSAPNSIVVRPVLPKLVRTQGFDSQSEALQFISQCIRDGYIIKAIAGSGTQYSEHYIVVAEKY